MITKQLIRLVVRATVGMVLGLCPIVATGDVGQDVPLFVAKTDGKAGFIDPAGQLVIQQRFENAYPFSDGLAAVQVGGRWGFIDPKGVMVIKPRYAQVRMFSDGLASFQNEFWDLTGYLDREGKVVIEPRFHEAEDFHGGVARVGVRENGLTAEERKKVVMRDVPPEEVQELWLRARKPVDHFFIDRTGKKVEAPGPAHLAVENKDELIPFKKDGKMGYIDAKVKVIIEPRFLAANAFFDGLACVLEKDLYGFIDRQGKYVIPPRFPYPNDFSDGLAGLPLGEKGWGLIDRKGETVAEPRYSWIYGRFRHGLVEVALNGKSAYINREGKQIWPKKN